MTAMANMGSLVVALPPSDIWLTDEQAADFLGYAGTYFKASIICLKGFPKPRYVTDSFCAWFYCYLFSTHNLR